MTDEEKNNLIETAEYLNAGCGDARYNNCINMDVANNPQVDVDIIGSVTSIPFPNERFKGVIFCHVLEHLYKRDHALALLEIRRVLKPNGTAYIEVPNIVVCLKYYLENYKGKKDYWYQCIYGRENYESDTHKSGVSEPYLTDLLFICGFEHLKWLALPEGSDVIAVIATKADKFLEARI
jgi:SAM-dependent methyltransferase